MRGDFLRFFLKEYVMELSLRQEIQGIQASELADYETLASIGLGAVKCINTNPKN